MHIYIYQKGVQSVVVCLYMCALYMSIHVPLHMYHMHLYSIVCVYIYLYVYLWMPPGGGGGLHFCHERSTTYAFASVICKTHKVVKKNKNKKERKTHLWSVINTGISAQ